MHGYNWVRQSRTLFFGEVMTANSIEEKVKTLFEKEKTLKSSEEFKKLITFIDAAIIQSAGVPDDERSKFLVKTMLSIKDFLSSEVVVLNFVNQFQDNVISTIAEETARYEWIKKKEELKEEPPQQESLSENDQLMLQSNEES